MVKLHSLTATEQKATIASLENAAKDSSNRYREGRTCLVIANYSPNSIRERTKWDVVVLQSYRDDLEGNESLYAQFAPKFTALAKAQGARVILYETTPTNSKCQALEIRT